jgi:CheY-like chemotaxis protein
MSLSCGIKKTVPPNPIPSERDFPLKIESQVTGKAVSQMLDPVSAILYPTVLVAEDSQDTRIMLKQAFELKGYRVYEAEDGKQALDLARRHRPSLIVIDLNMPVLDGLETVRRFRNLEGNGDHVPIVAITAYDVYGMEEAALETGCNKYLSKPFNLDELDRALRGLGFVV